jgi:CheY-like chemotaxis protein
LKTTLFWEVALKTAESLDFAVALDSDGNQYPKILAARGAPKAILLDLHLPYVSGMDLLKRFRSDERLKETPVFVMTADLFQARELEEQGERVFINPVSVARLQDIFSRLKDNA